MSQQFWEDSFHADVEKQIRQLYLTPEEVKAEQELQQLNNASSPVNVSIITYEACIVEGVSLLVPCAGGIVLLNFEVIHSDLFPSR